MIRRLLRWLRILPENRKIFRYWDGTRWKRIDPMTANRKLWSYPDYGSGLLVAADREPDPDLRMDVEAVTAAQSRVLEIVREVFDVAAYDGARGLTAPGDWRR